MQDLQPGASGQIDGCVSYGDSRNGGVRKRKHDRGSSPRFETCRDGEVRSASKPGAGSCSGCVIKPGVGAQVCNGNLNGTRKIVTAGVLNRDGLCIDAGAEELCRVSGAAGKRRG